MRAHGTGPRPIGRGLAVLAILFACLAPAWAAPPGTPLDAPLDAQSYRNFLLNIRQMPAERARTARDGLAAKGRIAGAELALVDALILAREGDLAGAEARLRALLEADPDRALVRLELVQVLIAAKRYTTARFQLRRLVQSEPDRELAQVYRALDRRISRLRPWDVSLDVSAAPRTNANKGASGSEFIAGSQYVVDEPFRAKAAVGLRYGGNASYRFLLSPEATLVTRGFTGGTHYESASLSNAYAGAGASVVLEPAPRRRFELGADVTAQWAGGDLVRGRHDATLYTPFASASFALRGALSAQVSQTVSRVDFADHGRDDGWRSATSLALTHAPRADRSASLSLRYDRDRVGLDYQHYDGLRAGVSLYRELGYGLTVDAAAFAGARRFDGTFPILGAEREDRYWGASLGLTKRDWAVYGFAPRFALSYERQTSNVARFTFDDLGATVGVSRGF